MFWKGFWLFGMPWSIAHQNPLSMGFLRQEYWSGLPFPSPGNLTDSRIEPRSLPLKADSLPSESPAKPIKVKWALRLENSSNRFSFSMKWNTREFSLLSLCLCVLFSVFPIPHPVWGRTENSFWEETVLTRTSTCWCPDLGLLAPRTVSK